MNPFEWREIATAQMKYGTDRSVGDVLADHRAKHEQAAGGHNPRAVRDLSETPRASELAKLREMLDSAIPAETTPHE